MSSVNPVKSCLNPQLSSLCNVLGLRPLHFLCFEYKSKTRSFIQELSFQKPAEWNCKKNAILLVVYCKPFLKVLKGAITLKPPVIFGITPKIVTLDDTPTWARIGGVCHLVKLPWLHPYDRLQVTVDLM